MNAQEAIKIKERKLEKDKDLLRYLKSNNCTHINIEKFEDEIKVDSIILESAKLFHKHTMPMLKRSNEKLKFINKPTTVYGVPLEKLGIKEGADE